MSLHVQFAAPQNHLQCHKPHAPHVHMFTALLICSAVGFFDMGDSSALFFPIWLDKWIYILDGLNGTENYKVLSKAMQVSIKDGIKLCVFWRCAFRPFHSFVLSFCTDVPISLKALTISDTPDLSIWVQWWDVRRINLPAASNSLICFSTADNFAVRESKAGSNFSFCFWKLNRLLVEIRLYLYSVK